MSRSQWVGHTEVARREIKGTFKRFTYFCNNHKRFIYCRTPNTFLKLFQDWCEWATIHARRSPNPVTYIYIMGDYHGVDMYLEDIVMDRPAGTEYRPKFLIQSQYGEYIQ
jgi:hypothetical protein